MAWRGGNGGGCFQLRGTPDGTSGGAPGGTSGGLPGGTSGGLPGGTSDGTPNGTPGGDSDGLSDGTPGGAPKSTGALGNDSIDQPVPLQLRHGLGDTGWRMHFPLRQSVQLAHRSGLLSLVLYFCLLFLLSMSVFLANRTFRRTAGSFSNFYYNNECAIFMPALSTSPPGL